MPMNNFTILIGIFVTVCTKNGYQNRMLFCRNSSEAMRYSHSIMYLRNYILLIQILHNDLDIIKKVFP